MILLGQGADRHGMRIQGHIHHFTAHISKIGVRGECLSQHAVDISQHVRRDKTRPGDQQHKHALVRVVLVRKPATLARGQGTLTAPDGGKYEGQFYEGMNMGRSRSPFPGKVSVPCPCFMPCREQIGLTVWVAAGATARVLPVDKTSTAFVGDAE